MGDGAAVLVVDDDPAIREFVGGALELEGYDVLTAPDGETALEIVGRREPCAVLLDMRMPVLDGWGFAAAYRGRPGAHAPVVVMTAAESARRWADEVGAEDVLGKPFSLDDLLAVVARHCAG